METSSYRGCDRCVAASSTQLNISQTLSKRLACSLYCPLTSNRCERPLPLKAPVTSNQKLAKASGGAKHARDEPSTCKLMTQKGVTLRSPSPQEHGVHLCLHSCELNCCSMEAMGNGSGLAAATHGRDARLFAVRELYSAQNTRHSQESTSMCLQYIPKAAASCKCRASATTPP
jgi:hypothetical protein